MSTEETEGPAPPAPRPDDWEPAVRPPHAGDTVPGFETEEGSEEEGSEGPEASEGSEGSGDSEEGTPGATEPPA